MHCDYTVLINSCDKYEELWTPFFTLFKRFWPDFHADIVLNTETKSFHFEGLRIKSVNQDFKGKLSWSKRLKKTLKQIDTKYVIILLDDFLLERRVDVEQINECIKWMNNDPNIAAFNFMPGTSGMGNHNIYKPFERQHNKALYRCNCQAAIWNRKALIQILRNHESPWQFERWGSVRSRRYHKEFYSWVGEENYVFEYNWGKPLIGGIWNLDEVERLENKLGIQIDTSKKECKRESDIDRTPQKQNIFSLKYAKKLFDILRSLI